MVNITKASKDYIKNHPYVRQSLKKDLINYSKLARLISKETGIDNFDAILIACRRYQEKISGSEEKFPPVMELLKGSKLSIRNKVVVVVLEPEVSSRKILNLQKEVEEKKEMMHVIRGDNAITLVTTEEFLDMIEKKFKNEILKISQDLVEIILKSSKKLESVPGVMGHLYSLFGENDINILETMSCWTDTIFVIREKNLAKTMDILDFD